MLAWGRISEILPLTCEQTSRCRACHGARSKHDVANLLMRRVGSLLAQRVLENTQVSASQASSGFACLEIEAVATRHARMSH